MVVEVVGGVGGYCVVSWRWWYGDVVDGAIMMKSDSELR